MSAISLLPVQSSQIFAIGHDPATNTLAIQFKAKDGARHGGDVPGSIYHYANFTAEDFAALSGAESIGSHFHKHIKSDAKKYPYTRVSDGRQS
jgi:hypothetical protein